MLKLMENGEMYDMDGQLLGKHKYAPLVLDKATQAEDGEKVLYLRHGRIHTECVKLSDEAIEELLPENQPHQLYTGTGDIVLDMIQTGLG